MQRVAAVGLLAVSASLLLAARADAPTRPSERASSTAPNASITAAAPLAFRQVSTGGGGRTCGVTATNDAYCWGDNTSGALGIGTSSGPKICAHEDFGEVPCSKRPVRVVGGLAFLQVSTGGGHSCGVTGRACGLLLG